MAKALNENREEWMLVGLLHDLDYDKVKNDMKMHGVVAAEMLKGKLPKSKLDKALIATDSIVSLIENVRMEVENLNVEKLRA